MTTLRRDSTDTEDYTIFDYGWDDCLEGKPQSDNPYAINNAKHYEWLQGWLAAAEACPDDGSSSRS